MHLLIDVFIEMLIRGYEESMTYRVIHRALHVI